jgi:hypothetical protein
VLGSGDADEEEAGRGNDSVGSSVVLSDGAAALVDDDGAGGAETSRELVTVPWIPVSVTIAVATGVPLE